MKEYYIIEAWGVSNMIDAVNKRLKDGWELAGPLVWRGDNMSLQPMVRELKRSESELSDQEKDRRDSFQV